MNGPFIRDGGRLSLQLAAMERGALRSVPSIVETGSGSGGRLDYTAHPDDAGADARYRELVSGDLDGLRRVDRVAFERVAQGESVDPVAVEAFMRVLGDARLVLAERIGIEEDGWEAEAWETVDPEVALLGWLGYLQDAAVQALSELL